MSLGTRRTLDLDEVEQEIAELASSEPVHRPQHAWSDDLCLHCGLTRTEAWVLDERGRPVKALIWSDLRGRPVRARPFAFMLGLTPPLHALEPVSVAFAGLDVGPEPHCAGEDERATAESQ